MTHPGTPRDVDIKSFLDGLSFKPANSPEKQAAHEVARQLVALLGAHLFELLPAGRDKSLVFTMLEDLLMRANRALALGGGPKPSVGVEELQQFLHDIQAVAVQVGALLPQDPRIEAYKAEQLGDTTGAALRTAAVPDMTGWDEAAAGEYLDLVNAEVGRVHPGLGWVPAEKTASPEKPFSRHRYTQGEEPDPTRTLTITVQEHWLDPKVSVEMVQKDEGENIRNAAGMDIGDVVTLRDIGGAFLAAADRLAEVRGWSYAADQPRG